MRKIIRNIRFIFRRYLNFSQIDWTGKVSITKNEDGSHTTNWTKGNDATPKGARNKPFVMCDQSRLVFKDSILQNYTSVKRGKCLFRYTVLIPEGWKNEGDMLTIEKHIKPLVQ